METAPETTGVCVCVTQSWLLGEKPLAGHGAECAAELGESSLDMQGRGARWKGEKRRGRSPGQEGGKGPVAEGNVWGRRGEEAPVGSTRQHCQAPQIKNHETVKTSQSRYSVCLWTFELPSAPRPEQGCESQAATSPSMHPNCTTLPGCSAADCAYPLLTRRWALPAMAQGCLHSPLLLHCLWQT